MTPHPRPAVRPLSSPATTVFGATLEDPPVDRPLLTQQTESIRAYFARALATDVSAYDRDELTILNRPDPPAWPYVALISRFGTGTIVSVHPEYRAFVDLLPAEPHRAATRPAYVTAIASEASRRGLPATAGSVAVLFALAAPPDEPAIPDGLTLRSVDRDWMAAEQRTGRFDNALGEPDETHRTERAHYARALIDTTTDEPVAVAGVFDTLGLHEIGVDVVPAHQGRGLAPIVVAAAARAILQDQRTPLYACSATNTRSQRTALTSGFLPIGADVSIR